MNYSMGNSIEYTYVDGRQVSPLEFETFNTLYNLIQEAPNYYVLGNKKVLYNIDKHTINVAIQDISSSSDVQGETST